jgi:acyl-CoA dehydrogenase
MVPYSHVLWAGLWSGIAGDAVARASAVVRAEARKQIGTVPPSALLLARVNQDLQAMRHNWQHIAQEFDEIAANPSREAELTTMNWALRLNQLKCACSEAGPKIVHQALQIAGLMGFKNDSPYSVGRHYRDLLSASLMVSNERISAKSASMLLVVKDD